MAEWPHWLNWILAAGLSMWSRFAVPCINCVHTTQHVRLTDGRIGRTDTARRGPQDNVRDVERE